MKQYCLKIKSKNKESLKKFLLFFWRHSTNQFTVTQKLITLRTNLKTFTLLKSPHVNKKAQEHFESNLFTNRLVIKGVSLKDNLIFFKKIFSKLFHDIHTNLEFITNKNLNKKNILLITNPNNFHLFQNKLLKTNLKRNKQKNLFKENSLARLFKILIKFSIFGEIQMIFVMKKNLQFK